jgi:hypothetical protein
LGTTADGDGGGGVFDGDPFEVQVVDVGGSGGSPTILEEHTHTVESATESEDGGGRGGGGGGRTAPVAAGAGPLPPSPLPLGSSATATAAYLARQAHHYDGRVENVRAPDSDADTSSGRTAEADTFPDSRTWSDGSSDDAGESDGGGDAVKNRGSVVVSLTVPRSLGGAGGAAFGGLVLEQREGWAGHLVGGLDSDSAAARAGVRSGDVIVSVDGFEVDDASLEDVHELIEGHTEDTLRIQVLRSADERASLPQTSDEEEGDVGGDAGGQAGGVGSSKDALYDALPTVAADDAKITDVDIGAVVEGEQPHQVDEAVEWALQHEMPVVAGLARTHNLTIEDIQQFSREDLAEEGVPLAEQDVLLSRERQGSLANPVARSRWAKAGRLVGNMVQVATAFEIDEAHVADTAEWLLQSSNLPTVATIQMEHSLDFDEVMELTRPELEEMGVPADEIGRLLNISDNQQLAVLTTAGVVDLLNASGLPDVAEFFDQNELHGVDMLELPSSELEDAHVPAEQIAGFEKLAPTRRWVREGTTTADNSGGGAAGTGAVRDGVAAAEQLKAAKWLNLNGRFPNVARMARQNELSLHEVMMMGRQDLLDEDVPGLEASRFLHVSRSEHLSTMTAAEAAGSLREQGLEAVAAFIEEEQLDGVDMVELVLPSNEQELDGLPVDEVRRFLAFVESQSLEHSNPNSDADDDDDDDIGNISRA